MTMVPIPHLNVCGGIWRCRVRSWYGFYGQRRGYWGNCPFYPTRYGRTPQEAYNRWVDAVQAERLAGGRFPASLEYAL